ncbi:hypothetical protein GGX14DRAFT_387746 [Mycena pura]|uniref:Uncharacterized protein n=1 Tax=Mycena pura TaxID=153505 RepID=A0AAD6YM49_9AGAR|nr:hypothetical protein GGX14DRAFT_387746 [Mycena pura]
MQSVQGLSHAQCPLSEGFRCLWIGPLIIGPEVVSKVRTKPSDLGPGSEPTPAAQAVERSLLTIPPAVLKQLPPQSLPIAELLRYTLLPPQFTDSIRNDEREAIVKAAAALSTVKRKGGKGVGNVLDVDEDDGVAEYSDKFWGLRAQPFPKFGQISGPWPPQSSDKSSDPSKIRKRPLGLLSGVLCGWKDAGHVTTTSSTTHRKPSDAAGACKGRDHVTSHPGTSSTHREPSDAAAGHQDPGHVITASSTTCWKPSDTGPALGALVIICLLG